MAAPTLVGVLGQFRAAKPDAAIHRTKITVAMSNSYVTGGETIDFSSGVAGVDIGVENIRSWQFGDAWGGYTPIGVLGATTFKIKVERTGAVSVPRVEETGGVDVGAVVTVGEVFIEHD